MSSGSLNNVSRYVKLMSQRPLGWEYTERSKNGLDHFKFEEVDIFFWYDLSTKNWTLPVYLSFVYITFIFTLQRWMRNKEPLKLERALFLWNLSLAIFAIFGVLRTVPGLVKVLLQPGGLYKSLCVKEGADAPVGFWIVYFCMSKFLVLGDTVFLVLRKKPLVLVHWGHHCLAMICCWWLGPFVEPIGRWCMILNYTEHSLMYAYFVLRSFKLKIPIIIPNIITTYQFGIMVVGGAFNVVTIYLYYSEHGCARDPISIKLSVLIAIGFISLLGKQFFDFVIMKGRQKKEALRKAQDLKSN